MNFSFFRGFEWDVGNVAKVQSRLDLSVAEFAFQGRPYVAFDTGHSTHEKRWLLVNKIGERFIFVSFTIRSYKIRIISARYMRKREVKRYENWFNKA